MTQLPETRYVRSADGTNLAYQVNGEGPLTLVFLGGTSISIDLMWDDPGAQRVSSRLNGFSRTVWFDGRGWGSSEGAGIDSTVGEVADADLVAVLDAVGSDQAVMLASSVSGQTAIHFAARNPERVSALVLFNTYCHYVRNNDFPHGVPPEHVEKFLADSAARWGTGTLVEFLAPSRASDEHFRQWIARCERLVGGPDWLYSVMGASYRVDYCSLLPEIDVPTLVLHRRANRYIRVEAGRFMADRIAGAKYVELPGEDHFFFVGDVDAWIDEVEEFLTGRRQSGDGEVVLSAVIFTDIVNSTAQQATLGHRAWTRLIEQYDALTERSIARYDGRLIKSLGDGTLATFGGSTRAVRCAMEIVQGANELGLELRAGVHTGEIELKQGDVRGLAVTIGKRVCDLAEAGQVLVSETVRGQIVGSAITLSERTTQVLKGVPGEWRLWEVQP